MSMPPQPRISGSALRAALLPAALAVAGCASAPVPAPYQAGVSVLARRAGAAASAAAAAEAVNMAKADFVLVEAEADSAWFADLAGRTNLAMSGPAIVEGLGFAYLAGKEPLGDTTLAIPVGGEESVWLHDALYELSDGVFLDLVAFRADRVSDIQELVKAFLRYVATDVMTNAPLVLGIEAPDDAMADSLAILLRPSFTPPASCASGGASAGAGQLPGLRLFIGTPAQIRCEEVEHPGGDPDALLARLVFRR